MENYFENEIVNEETTENLKENKDKIIKKALIVIATVTGFLGGAYLLNKFLVGFGGENDEASNLIDVESSDISDENGDDSDEKDQDDSEE